MGSVSWSIPGTLLKLNGIPTSGAVAQLGERLVRNEEATGSIPVSSTKVSSTSGCPKTKGCPTLSQKIKLAVRLPQLATQTAECRCGGTHAIFHQRV